MGRRFEDGGFLALIVVITLTFGWLIAPLYAAIIWGVIVAVVFRPVYLRLQKNLNGRRNLPAAICILLILALVVLPAFLLALALIDEAASLYVQLQSGDINLSKMVEDARSALPQWAEDLIVSAGWTDMDAMRDVLGNSLTTVLENVAGRALWFGQGALQLLAMLGVMLYLAFFLIRDGDVIADKVKAALPLRRQVREQLIDHFVVVVRATMKGTVVVAALQGFAGGVIFWMLGIEAPILWGLLMALFSLFPAIGTGIVWVPVAIYLLATGSTAEGLILVFCGLFVIGLIDNILRPILVGHDTKMPEFVVLIATVAGLKLMGLNGVIVGPIIAALFMAVWQIAAKERPWDQEAKVPPDMS